MKTKLILFYGPGSGSEKSTLSRHIHDVLQQRGVRTKSDDIRDLITYFNKMEEVAFELLTEWPFKQIVLDTAKNDLPTCAEEILRRLGIDGNVHAG
jgi:tRNA uridine 5-carbamoylmethylation protein Kti12